MQIIKNQDYNIEITGMTSEGSGVGKIDGFAVFVPNTAVGDKCVVKILKVNKSYAYGKVIAVTEPSCDRRDIDCGEFLKCGGCTYRHISYDAELKIKYETVESAFKRIGGFDVSPRPIIGSEKTDSYRNKAQYPVAMDKDERLYGGFFAPRSHRIIENIDCRLQPHIFGEIKTSALKLAQKYKISAYDESSGKGLLRHIYLRQAQETDEIMLCFVAAAEHSAFKKIAMEIVGEFPSIKSVMLNINGKRTNVILGEKCAVLYGADAITDILCGIKVRLSPLSFYQVNHDQAQRLYQKAIEYARLDGKETLIDLYCGAGTIGLAAAKKVQALIGVEIVPQAIENAEENAEKNGIKNARFICADAGGAASRLAEEGVIPDVIIVDPPRKGLDEQVIDAIVKMSPKRVVMVSCNPATAARDCKLLCEQGYALSEYTPLDMFPRTSHVECVCLMTRTGK